MTNLRLILKVQDTIDRLLSSKWKSNNSKIKELEYKLKYFKITYNGVPDIKDKCIKLYKDAINQLDQENNAAIRSNDFFLNFFKNQYDFIINGTSVFKNIPLGIILIVILFLSVFYDLFAIIILVLLSFTIINGLFALGVLLKKTDKAIIYNINCKYYNIFN